MSQDDRDEGWSLGADNVPPAVREERERRFQEKRVGGENGVGRTDPSPQFPPARAAQGRPAATTAGAGREMANRQRTATATEMVIGQRATVSGQQTAGSETGNELGVAAGTPPRQPAGRRRYETQLWQTISGLTPEGEGKFSRSERRFAIRKLFKEFERLVREALSEHEKDAEREERTMLWTPLEAICVELGIARRKLSALVKELTGMSAQEAVDRIRAEGIGARIKTELRASAKSEYVWHFENAEESYRKRAAPPAYEEWQIKSGMVAPEQVEKEKLRARALAEAGMRVAPKEGWSHAAGAMLKRVWNERRSRPEIAWAPASGYAARQAFARELGFSSYARLYRACLLSSGKSPMELEHAAALELFAGLDGEYAGERARVRGEVLG